MTPAALARYGTLLLGERWQEPLARQLHRPGAEAPGIDPRLVRRWASGERPIPAWVREQLRALVRERRRELARLR
jgi:hypothetical protein